MSDQGKPVRVVVGVGREMRVYLAAEPIPAGTRLALRADGMVHPDLDSDAPAVLLGSGAMETVEVPYSALEDASLRIDLAPAFGGKLLAAQA
jgi:hypothetical protein